MADSGWLRFLGGTRARTSRTLASPRSEPALRLLHQNSQVADDSHGQQRKAISRLSSWHGLMVATSVTAKGNDEPSNHVTGEEEMVWHNPSIDQMTEALRVAMMTKSVVERLPIEYCSHIMHLIEGYSIIKEKTKAVERELVETKALRQEEYDEYRSKQEDWMIREARYKAEVKRLEVFIHQTSDTGLEAVALARSGSLLRAERNISAEFKGDLDDGDDEKLSLHGQMLGHHSSILSRPRIVDANSDVRLSRRLRRHMTAVSQGQRHAHHSEECASTKTSIHVEAFEDTPLSASLGAGDMSLHEGSEDIKDSSNLGAPLDHRGRSDSRSCSESLNDRQEAKAPRARHRRQFSFVPGDDMSAVPGLTAASTTPKGRHRGDETQAASGRNHKRNHGRLHKSRPSEGRPATENNTDTSKPLDGEGTAERSSQ